MNKIIAQMKFKDIAIVSLIAIFFIIDRVLKILAYRFFLEETSSLRLIGNWFYFDFAKNYQIAFSLPFGGPWLLVITAAIILLITLFIINLTRRHKKLNQEATWLILILAGAISNFIDRFNYGYVIDYLAIKNLSVLNLADVMISLGTLFLIIVIWRDREDKIKHNLLGPDLSQTNHDACHD